VKLGDLVSHDNHFWIVARYDPKRTRTATLLNREGLSMEIPHNEPVEVVANPSRDWPFVAAPVKPMLGPVVGITRSSSADVVDDLELYRDWIPSEPTRAGGSIFLSPLLRLRPGDFLLLRHVTGKTSRVVIPHTFGTIGQKQARNIAKPKPVKTAYTRLLDDDDPFGDDD
jgi:hypothetical protein